MNFIEKLNEIKVEDIVEKAVDYVENLFKSIPGEEKKKIAIKIINFSLSRAYDLVDTKFKFSPAVDSYVKEIFLPSLVEKLIDAIILEKKQNEV